MEFMDLLPWSSWTFYHEVHGPSTFFFFFFFCEVGPNWDLRTQARWPIALYLSFKLVGGYLGVLPPYRGQRSRSVSPLLFVADATR